MAFKFSIGGEDDPNLAEVTMARAGVTLRIQAQVLAAESGFIAARAKTDDPASLAEIAAMVRRVCTVPADAEKCTDGEMQAAYMGVMKAVNSAGN